MTAIAGLWRYDGRPDGARELARMLNSQRLYGPDELSNWSDGTVSLGRCLFRNLPEDRFDRQPLHSPDARLILVADVRLDNREELAAALGLPKGRIAERCDAALLLDCLVKWGDRAVDRLVGDYAFACWDEPRQTLLLARDFRGNRPLYFHRGGGFLAFASMPKGLHAVAEIPRQPNQIATAELLLMIPAEGTTSVWDAIERVPPATILSLTRSKTSTRRYWEPVRPDLAAPRKDYVEGVRFHLDQAVAARLRGAANLVGAHLSAGLDSAAVAATAARLMSDRGRVTAFTAVPHFAHEQIDSDFSIFDEGPLAAATAQLYSNIDHQLIYAGRKSPIATLDKDFFLFETPLLNRCNMNWVRGIHEEASKRGIGVMLTGDNGNMSLTYAGEEYLPELLQAGRVVELARVSTALVRSRSLRKRGLARRLIMPFLPPGTEAWLRQRRGAASAGPLAHSALNFAAVAQNIQAYRLNSASRYAAEQYWRDGFTMRLAVMQRQDPGNYNMGAIGGWRIDQRDPTSDRRLVEYMLAVPMAEYVAGGRFRSLPRRALADRLPPAVLNARGKGRQAADWYLGLTEARAEIREELSRLRASGAIADQIDVERLTRLEGNWPATGWGTQAVRDDYRIALLRGVSVGHFLRKASGSNS